MATSSLAFLAVVAVLAAPAAGVGPGLGVLAEAVQAAADGLGHELWEAFVVEFSNALLGQRYVGAHFLCQSEAVCATQYVLRRLSLPSTHSSDSRRRGNFSMLPPKNVFFVVGKELDACQLVKGQTRQGDTLVVVVSFLAVPAFLADMGAGFESCWRQGMLNVMAVRAEPLAAPRADRLSVYTYFPYYPGNCRDMRPRLLRSWTPSSALELASLGLDKRISNLNQCELRVCTFYLLPFTRLVPNGLKSKYTLHGLFSRFIAEVERRLNFSAVFSPPSDMTKYGTITEGIPSGGLFGDLYHNRTDLGLTFTTSTTSPVVLHMDRPTTAWSSCTTWCLHTGSKPYPRWRTLVDEFQTPVWVALLAAYLLATAAVWWLEPGVPLLDAAFRLRALLAGAEAEPRGNASRAFHLSWYFFGLVVSTLYIAEQHSIFTGDTLDTMFRTLKELAQSDIRLSILQEHYDGLVLKATNEDEARIAKRVKPFPLTALIPAYVELRDHDDLGMGTDLYTCRYFSLLLTPKGKAPLFHSIQNYCLARSSACNLLLKKGNHLIKPLSKLLSRLDQGGFTSYWFDPGEFQHPKVHDPVLRMRQMLPFMVLLGIGTALAAAAFVAELAWFYGFLGHRPRWWRRWRRGATGLGLWQQCLRRLRRRAPAGLTATVAGGRGGDGVTETLRRVTPRQQGALRKRGVAPQGAQGRT